MSPKESEYLQRINSKCAELGLNGHMDSIFVSIRRQKLYHFNGDKLRKVYVISTSAKPPSNVENSLGTPSGMHRIAKKIGANAPLGMIFKGRQQTGVCYQEDPSSGGRENLITTRILWLEGMEEGVNRGEGKDSYERYIYIHGTNHEERVGSPLSHGCILMTNEDILEFYNIVEEQAPVLIDSSLPA